MSSTRRHTFAGTLALLGVLVAGAALAWACTPQAGIGISASSGPPGTQVQVTGRDFFPGGPVSITWNGGQTLATATGPDFTVSVTIPNAPAEAHTIVAVGREQNGSAVGRARATFTIPGTEPTPASTPGSSRPGSNDAAAPGSASGSASGGETSAGGRGAAVADGGGRTVSRAEGVDRSALPGEAPVASADSVFADSTVRSQGRGEAAIRARTAGARLDPSARSAAADLWSGFERGSDPTTLANTGVAAESGSLPGLTLALLGLGLAAALGGTLVMGARRRRAPARTPRRTGSD